MIGERMKPTSFYRVKRLKHALLAAVCLTSLAASTTQAGGAIAGSTNEFVRPEHADTLAGITSTDRSPPTLPLSGAGTNAVATVVPGGLISHQVNAAGSANSVQVVMTVEAAPPNDSSYFWAQQFFTSRTVDHGGYFGLQTGGVVGNRNVGKMAIFSIWNATAGEAGPGATAQTFGGEGIGYSVRMPFNWQPGVRYQFVLEKDGAFWWRLTINGGGNSTYLGRIQITQDVPLQPVFVAFTEFFRSLGSCADLPYVRTAFTDLTYGGQVYRPTSARAYGNCITSARGKATRVGAVHEAGMARSPGTYDFDDDGIPDGVETTVGTNPNAKDNNIFANSRLFVMQMYRDFLTREGDAGGVDFWVGRIDRGERTRAQMAEEYVNSLEFQGRIAPIVRLGFAINRTIPNYADVFATVAQRDVGRSLEQIGVDMLASSPRAAIYTAQSDSAFVNSLYSDLLGRLPTNAELDAAPAAIGSVGRGGFIARLANGDEYSRLSYNSVYVTMMYMGMLRRAPEQGGFDFWVGVMRGGQSGLGLVQSFLDAPEFRARFL